MFVVGCSLVVGSVAALGEFLSEGGEGKSHCTECERDRASKPGEVGR